MKKLHAILLLLGFAFLVSLVWTIGVSRLWNALASLGWGLVPFIALEFGAEAVHTLGWSCCLTEPYRRLPWLLRFRIRLAGNAIAYLTPTAALGGELTKAALLSMNLRAPEAVSGVLVGRLSSGIGHLAFVAAGSVIVVCGAALPRAAWAAMFLTSGLVAAGIFAFLWLQKYGKLGALVRWLAARKFAGASLQKLARQISEVDKALKVFHHQRPHALRWAVGWHLLGHSLGFVQTGCFFWLVQLPIHAGAIATVWVLGMWFDLLAFAVPLNLGTLEGSRIVAFKAVGLGAVSGMTYGLALRLAQLACVGFGLLNYALFFNLWRSPTQRPTLPRNIAPPPLKK
jgi:hypothetical protein